MPGTEKKINYYQKKMHTNVTFSKVKTMIKININIKLFKRS